jgi:hypothetical protein
MTAGAPPAPYTPAQREQRRLVLTAHPLQRVGAFAIAALARARTPDAVTVDDFDQVTTTMTKALVAVADVEKAQDPGGFWLGVSYLFWPNSKMNTTNRGKLLPEQRRDATASWRHAPDPDRWPGVPCALCGRPACGYYGKVDVPLAVSVEQRNSSTPGHDGLALCLACLTCFHALPYGCAIGGGRATALHSWDEDFVAGVTRRQVGRTRQQGTVATVTVKPPPFARELAALKALRGHGRRLTAGVELIVFTNSNKEQTIETHRLDQPLAEWLRSTSRAGQGVAFGHLLRTQATEKVPGRSMLARRAFREPEQILAAVTRYLRRRTAQATGAEPTVPHATGDIVALALSYAKEVLRVKEKDVEEIQALADHVATVLAPTRKRGALKAYETAHRSNPGLQTWLRKVDVDWTLHGGPNGSPFVTTRQWRLLFDPDQPGYHHRALLFIAVLERLQAAGWKADDATPDDKVDPIELGSDDDALEQEQP